jgi:hypothetical protein
MNRHERRRLASKRKRRWEARVGSMVDIGIGRLLERDRNYGTAVNCYVCSTPHAAYDLARIEDQGHTLHVPLCPHCAATDQTGAVFRKYVGVPDMKITDGGEASKEQINAIAAALAEREGASQH